MLDGSDTLVECIQSASCVRAAPKPPRPGLVLRDPCNRSETGGQIISISTCQNWNNFISIYTQIMYLIK